MKGLILVVFCLLASPLIASHIVGGEFEIIHLTDYRYRVNLIIYFDEFNGLQANKAQDQIIIARIFRVRDNAVMRDVVLPYTQISNVNYTQSECAVGELQTSRMYYTTEIQLPPEQYNDPQGYYIVWERCCRNYTIKNIYSLQPDQNPGYGAGQTFYLKFPPVTMGGRPFVNSSPRLFPPLSDYACINRPYYANFAGTDDDGDSLSYTIVTPFSTHTQMAYPPILAAPYPLVKWRDPYNQNNVMNGSPDLDITPDGLLTVTPSNDLGLFVFAVRCDEFRNGVKIGEVRRDFQMLVQDCKDAVPPSVSAKTPDGNYTQSNLNVTYANTVTDDKRCVTIRVTDADAFRLADGEKETVSIRVIPIGFKTEEEIILPGEITTVLTPQKPYHEFEVCFDKCPLQEGPYKIGIISFDDACALPLTDTVMVTVNIQAPDNVPVTLSPDVAENIQEGVSKTWTILATDGDNDPLLVDIIPVDFELADAGLSIQQLTLKDGRYEARLRWDALCDVYDFSEKQDFRIKVVVDDVDVCLTNPADTMFFDLHVVLPYSNPPVIGSDLSAIEIRDGIERSIFESLRFNVFGTDADPQILTLQMVTDFSAADHGISFPSATGKHYVSSVFNWNLLCEKVNLAEKEDFELVFIVRDPVDKCGIYRADTLRVNIHVSPAVNHKPEISVANLSPEIPVSDGELQMLMGQSITLKINGVDPDVNPLDPVRVELISAEGNVVPEGYSFNADNDRGTAHGLFTWTPDCSAFKDHAFENHYLFTFRTVDDRCGSIMGDTTEVMLSLKDLYNNPADFIPPNFITPNADGCNDFFGLEDIESASCGETHVPKLPADNCLGRFTSVRIYNRWGNEVFISDQRNFRWYPDGEAAGIYFYTLYFTHTEYKGSITVMY